MAVVKLTKSGKAVQFIDDDNHIYQMPKAYLLSLLMGTARYQISTLSRMPWDAQEGKFPKSKVWGGDEETNRVVEEQIERGRNTDLMSGELKRKLTKKKTYTEADEW